MFFVYSKESIRWNIWGKKIILLHCSFTKNSFRSRAAGEKYLHRKEIMKTFHLPSLCIMENIFCSSSTNSAFHTTLDCEETGSEQGKLPKKFSFIRASLKKFLCITQGSKALSIKILFSRLCVFEYFNVCWMKSIFLLSGCTTNWGYSVGSDPPTRTLISFTKKISFPPFFRSLRGITQCFVWMNIFSASQKGFCRL